MPCTREKHKDAARYLVPRGAQYVMTVKSNHRGLLEACRTLLTRLGAVTARHFEPECGLSAVRERERELTVADAHGIAFPGIKQVARVRRWTGNPAPPPAETSQAGALRPGRRLDAVLLSRRNRSPAS
jgi:hypothetical protein